MSPTEWRTILARLRRARLLAEEDPHNPGQLDTHPLVREYFGEQLRSQQTDAWKECNRRLYNHYRALAPSCQISFREMEPLFLAVICGCNAGLFREALHEVYIPRIQRGNASFAANVLGARGALLSVLVHFFEHGRWGSPVEMAVEGQSLTAEDQLFILMQAGRYLTATRGLAAPEARICYERAEPLCHSLNRPRLLYVALMGQWRYSLVTDKLTARMRLAERVYSLAQEQNDARLMIGAYRRFGSHALLFGRLRDPRDNTPCVVFRSGAQEAYSRHAGRVHAPSSAVCAIRRYPNGISERSPLADATMAEAISLAKELNDMPALAVALCFARGTSLTLSVIR